MPEADRTTSLDDGNVAGDPRGHGDDVRAVPLRHPGRWVASALVLVVAVAVASSLVTNERFQWDVVGEYFFSSAILSGLWTTLWLTAVSMTIAVVLGIIIALMRLSPNPVLKGGANLYTWFFRGTPLLVQLIFLFNISALYPVLTVGVPFGPKFFDIPANDILTPALVAIIGLSLNEAAYMAEIVRGGINSVEHGQTEAAQALGLRRSVIMRRIVLPQAIRVILPPTGNETISMLKYTSLISVIAMPELLYSAQVIYSRTYETIPLLMVASLWYLIVTSVLTLGQTYLERRTSRHRRTTETFAGGLLRRLRPHDTRVTAGRERP
ncbi:amino acid ABC transporter permease [Nonomuraea cavernae]|uniref:Amino acid ABC transporter permease n=1 Tax=Nonomuraea cavernae TaxID=2045107 RepID=A0A918DTD3_9ACTN|nr:amino acid ABC transporter permease [Nonomuraea cavernae]MCA2190567.1 amino acid ABC transporter permease [Nonomuraea cavernae]GGO82586.1 amino acid ABC transporter permease [Nonomuraea cavernae]